MRPFKYMNIWCVHFSPNNNNKYEPVYFDSLEVAEEFSELKGATTPERKKTIVTDNKSLLIEIRVYKTIEDWEKKNFYIFLI